MNILKIGLVLLSGTGIGFGLDKLMETESVPINQVQQFRHMYQEDFDQRGYCHGNSFFLDHMLENLSEEELIIVQTKLDELLNENGITLEELETNHEIRFDLMIELMTFLDENNIEYHHHGSMYIK